MTQLPIHDALQLALRHQHAGNLKNAEQIYRQILQTYPDQPDALHLLGMIAYQANALPEAENLVRRAIALSPQPAFSLTLGGILLNAKRPDEALQLYRDLLAKNPTLPEAHTHLAIALCSARRHDESIPHFEKSLQLDPANPYTRGNLGIALTHTNNLDAAITHLQAATTALPMNPDFHSALATAALRANKFEDAITAATRALQLAPNRGQPHHTLSLALTKLNKPAEALPHAQRAAELLPDNPDVHSILADLQRTLQQPDAAIATYRRAIEKNPSSPELHANLGTLLLDQSQHDEAITHLRRALSLAPKRPDIHSALLHALLFHPTFEMKTLLDEHKEFARRHAESLYPVSRNYPNEKNPDKILRIAYLSSELRAHPIGLFLLPLLQFHDKSQVETFLYSDTKSPDAITTHLQSLADHFHDTSTLTDAQLADKIRLHQIDLLIDLHQHSPGNRLLTFARKPAPLQLSLPLHSFTTALPTIDYRLESIPPQPPTKPAVKPTVSDGAGQCALPTAESCIPVSAPLTCYLPRAESIPLTPPPLSQTSPTKISFASLASPAHLNPQTLTLFAQLLHALPNSTLTLLAPEGAYRTRTTQFFQHNNIPNARLNFVAPQPNLAHFQLFNQIDISLDTFPINTPHLALDSLFMGVPLITLTDPSPLANPLSKTVHTFLHHLGLPDLSTTTPAQFIDTAKSLATDLPRLTYLRQNLRTRLRNSPLMSPTTLSLTLERAYRSLWQKYCASI